MFENIKVGMSYKSIIALLNNLKVKKAISLFDEFILSTDTGERKAINVISKNSDINLIFDEKNNFLEWS